MPLKGLTKRLKKTFSFRSRGAYDFKDSVDPALRRYQARDTERSSGDSDTYRRNSQDSQSGQGISGVGIGSTNSLQQPPHNVKSKPHNRGSVGSLNDLPTAELEKLPPIRLVKEINYEDDSLIVPSSSKSRKGEKVTTSEIKHFKRGVQLADRIDEDDCLLEDSGTAVEHNLIYQGVGFRRPKVSKVDKKVDSAPNPINEFDDPNYSTIPHFSKAKAEVNPCASNRIKLEAVVGASSIRRDFDEAGYSTVPEARAAAGQSLFSTDTDFVNISNFSSIPEATVSLDDDPGYETLDETKKKVNILKRQSVEATTQDNKLVLIHKVRQTESTAVQTDDIYDNNLISPLREPSNVYDNVSKTPLVSPQSCVSGYNSLGNSPSSPPTTSVVTGTSVLSSQDSGIDGAGPVFTPPGLLKLTSPQRASPNTPRPLHVATLVTITGDPNQHTFALDEESQALKGNSEKDNKASQATGITSPSDNVDNVDDCLYSTVGNRTDRASSSDKHIEVVNDSEPVEMDTDDIAPPIPSRNYLRDDLPNDSVAKQEKMSMSAGSLDSGVGALSISQDNKNNFKHVNSATVGKVDEINAKCDLKLKDQKETSDGSKSSASDIENVAHRHSHHEKTKLSCELISNSSSAELQSDKPVEIDKEKPSKQGDQEKSPEQASDGKSGHVRANSTGDQGNRSSRNSNDGRLSSEDGSTSKVEHREHGSTSQVERREHGSISKLERGSGQDQSLDASSDRPASGTSGSGSSNPNSPGANSTDDFQVDLVYSFKELKQSGWYWGPLSAAEAEAKLANKPDGSFLVRDSSDERYILSISFNSQGSTHHTRIEHYKGHFSFYSQPTSHGYGTITEFIERVMQHSRNGSFSYFLRPSAPGSPPMQVRLLFPVSRLRVMRSLQHMCRFLILKHVRIDLIDKLPLPERVRAYLKEQQYYIEFLED